MISALSPFCLSFLAVGDWGRRGAEGQRAVAQGLARAAQRLGSAFVLTTGDNFYEDGVESAGSAHWQESFEAAYGALPQGTTWHAALGNHDYRGSVAAQIAYTRRSSRWHLPARFYTFTRPVGPAVRAQFFVLDTTPMLSCYRPGGSEPTPGVSGQDPKRQLAWLRRALAASTASWKIVVGHRCSTAARFTAPRTSCAKPCSRSWRSTACTSLPVRARARLAALAAPGRALRRLRRRRQVPRHGGERRYLLQPGGAGLCGGDAHARRATRAALR